MKQRLQDSKKVITKSRENWEPSTWIAPSFAMAVYMTVAYVHVQW